MRLSPKPSTSRCWRTIPTICLWLGVSMVVGCATEQEIRFQAHINYLASDELEGRGLGSQGIEKAASYIADQFKQIGLEPAGDSGTYFQSFDMILNRLLDASSHLSFNRDSTKRTLGEDYIPFSFSSDNYFNADTVFCGYGIVASDRDRDDYVHVDVEGKAVLIFRGEPASWADENGSPTQHATLQNKIYNAKDRKAAVVIIVNQKPEAGETDGLIEFSKRRGEAYGMPAFHITRDMAQAHLQQRGLASLDELQKKLDEGQYLSQKIPGMLTSGRAVFHEQHAEVKNVIGLLRGEGPMANEFIVVGAHYDHLGVRKPMMRRFDKGKVVTQTLKPEIHNGADDNASGTSGLIEVARQLANQQPLQRSLLFIAFTAEETGLQGSTHYVDNPVVPLYNTIAMLNMDMIGRMKPGSKSLQVFGVGTGRSFEEILAIASSKQDFSIVASPEAGGRSDHAAFARRNIPTLHFFSGQHSDYHKPGDDSHKINTKDGVKVTSLVADVTHRLSKRSARPTYQEVNAPQQSLGDTPTYRVVMGLTPGYGNDGNPGMKVEAVSPEGPADQAGMKPGDRILHIGDKPISNIYDYMAATRTNSPGDVISVIVKRQGREVTLKVTLSGAR